MDPSILVRKDIAFPNIGDRKSISRNDLDINLRRKVKKFNSLNSDG